MQPGHDDNGASLQIHRTVMLYLDMHKGKPAKQMLQKRVIFSFTDVGLAQILTEVVEEVRLSIDREVNGADLLYSLLSAPWLYSLLRVRHAHSILTPVTIMCLAHKGFVISCRYMSVWCSTVKMPQARTCLIPRDYLRRSVSAFYY